MTEPLEHPPTRWATTDDEVQRMAWSTSVARVLWALDLDPFGRLPEVGLPISGDHRPYVSYRLR